MEYILRSIFAFRTPSQLARRVASKISDMLKMEIGRASGALIESREYFSHGTLDQVHRFLTV